MSFILQVLKVKLTACIPEYTITLMRGCTMKGHTENFWKFLNILLIFKSLYNNSAKQRQKKKKAAKKKKLTNGRVKAQIYPLGYQHFDKRFYPEKYLFWSFISECKQYSREQVENRHLCWSFGSTTKHFFLVPLFLGIFYQCLGVLTTKELKW